MTYHAVVPLLSLEDGVGRGLGSRFFKIIHEGMACLEGFMFDGDLDFFLTAALLTALSANLCCKKYQLSVTN